MAPHDISVLQSRYQSFIEQRNWEEFQTPKNIAEAVSIEASELLECFLWHDNLDAESIQEHPEVVNEAAEEIADVFIYLLGLASELDIDLVATTEMKLRKNEQRFDIEHSTEIAEDLYQFQR